MKKSIIVILLLVSGCSMILVTGDDNTSLIKKDNEIQASDLFSGVLPL